MTDSVVEVFGERGQAMESPTSIMRKWPAGLMHKPVVPNDASADPPRVLYLSLSSRGRELSPDLPECGF